jgi:hypothetical protein
MYTQVRVIGKAIEVSITLLTVADPDAVLKSAVSRDCTDCPGRRDAIAHIRDGRGRIDRMEPVL